MKRADQLMFCVSWSRLTPPRLRRCSSAPRWVTSSARHCLSLQRIDPQSVKSCSRFHPVDFFHRLLVTASVHVIRTILSFALSSVKEPRMSSPTSTSESIIGNAVSFMRTVVLTRISPTAFFTVAKVIAQHTDSHSVGDRSVVADKDTYERDWRVLVVWRLQVVEAQSPGTSTEDRIRHDFLLQNFRHSRRFSQL